MLIRGLEDEDWLVRLHAVQGLAGRTTEDAREALTRALEDEEEMIRTEPAGR